MAPLNAPLPTAMNFPFQPAAGSQTSILMSESCVGFNVAATRQNAGSDRNGCAFAAAGGVNEPASTPTASVIVVAGSVRFDNASHAALRSTA